MKVLAILGLAATLGFGACKGATNTNTANTAMNSNMAMATPSPVMKTGETAATDPNMKSKIEAALKAKGFTDVTVDTTTTPKMTLRGTVAKDKMPELMAAVMESNGGKPVDNQVQGK